MRDRLIELLKKADEYASGVCTDYDEAQEVCADTFLPKVSSCRLVRWGMPCTALEQVRKLARLMWRNLKSQR